MEQRNDERLLDVRLDEKDSSKEVSSDAMRKAIDETKREIQQAFGDKAKIQASTK